MPILAIALFSKNNDSFDILYTAKPDFQQNELRLAINETKKKALTGMVCLTPSSDKECFIYLDVSEWHVYLFLTTHPVDKESARFVINELKNYIGNPSQPMTNLITRLEHHFFHMKISNIHQILNETQEILLEQLDKLMIQENKLHLLIEKLETMNKLSVTFKTQAFKHKQSESLFNWFTCFFSRRNISFVPEISQHNSKKLL